MSLSRLLLAAWLLGSMSILGCARQSPSESATTKGASAVGAVRLPAQVPTSQWPLVKVTKNASCGCCTAWVDRMRQAGFRVEIHDVDNLDPVKTRVGIPVGKGSCHTAEVGGYFVGGHVPPEDVKRLLREQPAARGLVLPGMPLGAPGMEVADGAVHPYTVELVGRDGTSTPFATHPPD